MQNQKQHRSPAGTPEGGQEQLSTNRTVKAVDAAAILAKLNAARDAVNSELESRNRRRHRPSSCGCGG